MRHSLAIVLILPLACILGGCVRDGGSAPPITATVCYEVAGDPL